MWPNPYRVAMSVDPVLSEAVEPEPDDKDWTWVLSRPCPQCGFHAASVDRSAVGPRIREYTGLVHAALQRPHAAQRPAPTVWSPLEYGAHVRDVCVLFEHRLNLMLSEHDPTFANWDQDKTAIDQHYAEQDPAAVAAELTAAAESVAAAFDSVADEDWQRPSRRSNGSTFTVDSFARYLLHDLAHHTWDVR